MTLVRYRANPRGEDMERLRAFHLRFGEKWLPTIMVEQIAPIRSFLNQGGAADAISSEYSLR